MHTTPPQVLNCLIHASRMLESTFVNVLPKIFKKTWRKDLIHGLFCIDPTQALNLGTLNVIKKKKSYKSCGFFFFVNSKWNHDDPLLARCFVAVARRQLGAPPKKTPSGVSANKFDITAGSFNSTAPSINAD